MEGGHVQILLTLPLCEAHFLLTLPPNPLRITELPNMHAYIYVPPPPPFFPALKSFTLPIFAPALPHL